jgi:hypothetical protein
LANGGQPISNQLWHLSERHATKIFFEVNQVHIPRTNAEDRQLIQDWLIIGPRYQSLKTKWMTQSASRLKNRWHHELRHRLHETGTDIKMLTKVLPRGCKTLLIQVLTKV